MTTQASAPGTAPLVVRTVEVDGPGALLSLLPEAGSLAWVRRGEGIVGWGEAARVRVRGRDRFADAERWWTSLVRSAAVRDEVRLPGSGPVAFGSFAFDAAGAGSALVVPEVVVGHRAGTWWVTTATVGDALPPPLADLADLAATSLPRRPSGTTFTDGARSGAEWTAVVAAALERIAAGEVDKVVLARDLVAEAAEAVDLRWPLRRLAESYPGCWTFAVDGLLGATPELLVRLDKGLVASRVLAGTIRRTGDDARDLVSAASLARSSKDLEEHEYAVRSVADALAPHCTGMNVPETPFVLHLPNVMHLATDVTGVVGDGWTSLRLAASLHPTAAVCGTPTDRAQDVIADIEGLDRGRYAGPVGWMDAGGDGEWGIALRCAEVDRDDPRRLRLYAGCGIVAGSDPEAELAESAAKLVPMRDALSG